MTEKTITLKWLEEYCKENIIFCYEQDGDWYYGMARGLELIREAAKKQSEAVEQGLGMGERSAEDRQVVGSNPTCSKNLQQEIVREIMVMDFEVTDVSIRNMIEKIVAHTLARAELYFVNSETKDLANAISKLEIDVDKAKARATAEMLKEVDKTCYYFCGVKKELKKRLRTQSGAGGK